LSEIDDDEYLANPENSQFVSFNSVAAIEPAVIPVLYLPAGTDLELTRDAAGLHFIDNATGEELPASTFAYIARTTPATEAPIRVRAGRRAPVAIGVRLRATEMAALV